MTTNQPPPRLRAKLRSHRVLRDAMLYARITVREMAMACGNPKHRSTIAHLRAGTRSTCEPFMARRIEECLRMAPGVLFELVVCNVSSEPTVPAPTRRKAAA